MNPGLEFFVREVVYFVCRAVIAFSIGALLGWDATVIAAWWALSLAGACVIRLKMVMDDAEANLTAHGIRLVDLERQVESLQRGGRRGPTGVTFPSDISPRDAVTRANSGGEHGIH